MFKRQLKKRNPNIFILVDDLKTANLSKWRKAVKNLVCNISDKPFHSVIKGNQLCNKSSKSYQRTFIAVNESVSLLSEMDKQPLITTCEYYIPAELIERRLERVKVSKASGPRDLPNWIFKHFSAELATPEASIFNAAIDEAYIIPVPKTHQVPDIDLPSD